MIPNEKKKVRPQMSGTALILANVKVEETERKRSKTKIPLSLEIPFDIRATKHRTSHMITLDGAVEHTAFVLH